MSAPGGYSYKKTNSSMSFRNPRHLKVRKLGLLGRESRFARFSDRSQSFDLSRPWASLTSHRTGFSSYSAINDPLVPCLFSGRLRRFLYKGRRVSWLNGWAPGGGGGESQLSSGSCSRITFKPTVAERIGSPGMSIVF